MKAYAILVKDGEYLEYSKHGFPVRFNSSVGARTTTDPAKAKHYKKEGIAKGVCKSRATERRNIAERQRLRIKNERAIGNNVSDWLLKSPKGYDESADFIDTFTVVEVDVETPNFSKQEVTEVRFEKNKWRVGYNTKKSQGNCYCKCCGIYFKNIPMLVFGGSEKPARICPWCIKEHAHDADKLLDGMKVDQRENVEAERFVHKMG